MFNLLTFTHGRDPRLQGSKARAAEGQGQVHRGLRDLEHGMDCDGMQVQRSNTRADAQGHAGW